MNPEVEKKRRAPTRTLVAVAMVVVVVAILGASLLYHPTTTTSSSTSQSTIQGIIAGIVTVGPSQPACSQNQACTVDLTGYSLVFGSQCAAPSCQNLTAPIAPSGHYSILLAPGNYTITGLSPSCSWVGCSSTFPKPVAVEAGQQLIVNINVDTGIR